MPSGTTDRRPRYVLYHRRETYAEKLDRNWSEILQELRILQTGLQLIAGFLLTLPFQSRFERLDTYAVTLYLSMVVTAAAAILVVLMPLSVHRKLFRRQVKNRLVASGAWAAKAGLALAAVLIMGTTALIFDVVLGRWQSWVAGGCLLLLCIAMFLAVPAVIARTPEPALLPEEEIVRHAREHSEGDGHESEDAALEEYRVMDTDPGVRRDDGGSRAVGP